MFKIQFSSQSEPFTVERREDVLALLSLFRRLERFGVIAKPYFVPLTKPRNPFYFPITIVSAREEDTRECLIGTLAYALREVYAGEENREQPDEDTDEEAEEEARAKAEAEDLLSRIREFNSL